MLPEIETFRKPVFGAAITWVGSKIPALVAPFPKMETVAAFALDERTVLFVVRRHRCGDSSLMAVYDLVGARIIRRAEFADSWHAHPLLSGDRRTLFLCGSYGIRVVDVATLKVFRRLELFRDDVQDGVVTTYDALDLRDRDDADPKRSPVQLARDAGWRSFSILTFGMVPTRSDVGERDADHLFVARRSGRFTGVDQTPTRWDLATIGWREGTVETRAYSDLLHPTALDRIDPQARLLHVSHGRLGVFLASPPTTVAGAGPFACPDPSDHALVLRLWRLGGVDADPRTVVARTAGFEVWSAAAAANRVQRRPGEPKLTDVIERLRMPSPDGEIFDPDLWTTAAGGLLGAVYEDPRDGLLWLSFADRCIRSLDDEGRLGPLIWLAGEGNMERDNDLLLAHCPVLTFEGASSIVVRISISWMMARYVFCTSDMAGWTEPVILQPARPGPLPGSHAKAFATWLRERRRDRCALPDWSRDSVAAALEVQRAAVVAGLSDLVDPEEDKLTFSYKVAGKPVKEATFFRRIAKDALPVVPELRALLIAYTDSLGEGGEGVQPWQDPDEAVGGLGPALHALALLDPDGLDVLRAYLETRDGEHEGYALDVVVPAFFKRHGWRDAAAVRFGIYATLNRFWGGRQPPEGFDGMWTAMARLLTPGEAAMAVLREAEHFGGKPEWGHDAAVYRGAFRSLLDTGNPYEAAVRDALREALPVD